MINSDYNVLLASPQRDVKYKTCSIEGSKESDTINRLEELQNQLNYVKDQCFYDSSIKYKIENRIVEEIIYLVNHYHFDVDLNLNYSNCNTSQGY